MATATVPQQHGSLTDEEIVARVLAGEIALFESLMRRHNRSVYRAAVAILRDETEAEDVMQEAYVRAYQSLAQFAGRARFSTWLIRIAVHEALARRRRSSRFEELDEMKTFDDVTVAGPEREAARSEVRGMLEEAVQALPGTLRAVLMLRGIEELSTAETAEVLGITEENVKIRLHRARTKVRKHLLRSAGMEAHELFAFEAPRCDRVVGAVLLRIQEREPDLRLARKVTNPLA